MKDPHAAILKDPIHNVQIISAQVSPEQLVNIIEPTLTSNLKIPTDQKLIKVLFRVSMAKSRRHENNIHQGILAIAIRAGNRRQGEARSNRKIEAVFVIVDRDRV